MSKPRRRAPRAPRRPPAPASAPRAEGASRTAGNSGSRRAWMAAALLAVVTFAVYARVARFGFMENYDDSLYVTRNPRVTSGLEPANLVWAFTQTTGGNWHPLTMLSHMLDCQLFGVSAGPAHVVNVLFHVANTLLVFWVLASATRRAWPSLFVAALFALHPMHVESVAWIAERKDVLSTFLMLLAIGAYLRYARTGDRRAYALAAGLLALGLMAKPMLVTLPFVLVLLDVWPLQRIRWGPNPSGSRPGARITLARSLLEKAPLLALVLVSIVLTLRAQSAAGAMQGTMSLPLALRLENALLATVAYVVKLFVPTGLAALYPYPTTIAPAAVAGAALLIVAVTAALVFARARAPWALTGWLWFLGTLVPVIGIVQVGSQSMADRYTYVPHIGLGIAVAWACAEAVRRWRVPRAMVAGIAIAVFGALATLTWNQVGYWRDGTRLFRRAIEVTQGNFIAHNNHGVEAMAAGRLDEALASFETAVRLNERYPTGLYNLGVAYRKKQEYDKAATTFTRALAVAPNDARAELNLAMVLATQGKYPEAFPHYAAALRLAPDQPEVRMSYSNALSNWGVALARSGSGKDAIDHFRKALVVNPDNQEARRNLEYQRGLSPEGAAGAPATGLR